MRKVVAKTGEIIDVEEPNGNKGQGFDVQVWREPVSGVSLMAEDEDAPPVELDAGQKEELCALQESTGLRFTVLDVYPGVVPIQTPKPGEASERGCHWYLVQFDQVIPEFGRRRLVFFLVDTPDRVRYAEWYKRHCAAQPVSGNALVRVSDGQMRHPYMRVEPRA